MTVQLFLKYFHFHSFSTKLSSFIANMCNTFGWICIKKYKTVGVLSKMQLLYLACQQSWSLLR